MITASFYIFSLPLYVREYIGQSYDNYFQDTNCKYSINNLIPTTRNGRIQKIKEYKRFVDMVRDSGYNVIYVIEEIEKQQKVFYNGKIKALKEISSLTSKKETQYIEDFVSKSITTNPVSTIDFKNNKQDDTIAVLPEREEIRITDYFSHKDNTCSTESTKTKLIELTTKKLMALSRYISDSFGNLLLSSSTTVDIIDNMYLFLPISYKNITVPSFSIKQPKPAGITLCIESNQSNETSDITDNSSYYNPMSLIKSTINCNNKFFCLLKESINELVSNNDTNDIVRMKEKWKDYVTNNTSTIIQLISYLTDDLLFYDIELYKCSSLKSVLRHNGTYNKFISYNMTDKKWYCIACLLYSNDPVILGNKYTYTTVTSHMTLNSHKSSLKLFKKLLSNLENNQTLITNSTNHCCTTDNLLLWKYFFTKFYNCMCVCLSDIHSIYGQTTILSSSSCGMFLVLLKLTGKNDPIFRQFLEENKRFYQSVRSIQRWITIISTSIMNSLKNEVGNKLFSITTDGTTSQHLEQLAITIRYVDSSYIIHQHFLYILEETSPSGIVIGKSLMKCLDQLNYNKNNLCGISYDNCICNTSLTSGIIAGLSVNPTSIIGYGCRVHLLNLALLDLQNNVIDSSLYIEAINNVASSWSRCSRIRVLIKNNGYSLYTLPQISQTRFTARYYSLYPYVVHPKNTLCKVFLLYFYSFNKNNICFKNCENMLKMLGEVSFHLYIESWFYILQLMNEASSQLQSETLTISETIQIINRIFDKLSYLSSANMIKKMYNNALERRDYIYKNISLLIHRLNVYKNNTEDPSCITSIIQEMNSIPEYNSKFNVNLDNDVETFMKDNDDSDNNSSNNINTTDLKSLEKTGPLEKTGTLYDSTHPNSLSINQFSFSISESILSILNYRDEMEKKNLQKIYESKGLQQHHIKKVKQNILINHDNDVYMAPVSDNTGNIELEMNKCVSNINCTSSQEYIQSIIKQEVEHKTAISSSPILSPSNNPNIYSVSQDDIEVFFSVLSKSTSTLEMNNDSSMNIKQKSDTKKNNINYSSILSSINHPKRKRGRPRKAMINTNDIDSYTQDTRSTSLSQKRIIHNENNKQNNDSSISFQNHESMFSLEEKKNIVESKLDSLVYTLYKDIIQDLSLSFFITPSMIIDSNIDTQLLYSQTLYSLFSYRLPIDFIPKICQMTKHLQKTISVQSSINDIIKCIHNEFPIHYSIYEMVIQICLTLSPTSIKSETCFSTLRRIKGCFQTSMKPELLQTYMACTCNRELLSSVNSSEVVDKYVDGLRLPILSNNISSKVLRSELLNCK
ncbi:hypothetical protein WA158_002338 [Blastocystis sp. Blastoise]